MVLGCDETGKDLQAAFDDRKVMEAAKEVDATHLDHTEPPPLGAVFDGELFEQNHAVGD